MKKAAVFLDRDGTIIEDTHYPKDPDQVRFVPGAPEALRALASRGYVLFVISNQSGVGRGLISKSQFEAVHERFCELLNSEQISIKEFSYCFHKPEDLCECRKPATKLIKKLSEAHEIDLSGSFIIGDKWSDILLGQRVGVKGVLLENKGLGSMPPELNPQDFKKCSNWREASSLIPPLRS